MYPAASASFLGVDIPCIGNGLVTRHVDYATIRQHPSFSETLACILFPIQTPTHLQLRRLSLVPRHQHLPIVERDLVVSRYRWLRICLHDIVRLQRAQIPGI